MLVCETPEKALTEGHTHTADQTEDKHASVVLFVTKKQTTDLEKHPPDI